jgi:hypothetical protein
MAPDRGGRTHDDLDHDAEEWPEDFCSALILTPRAPFVAWAVAVEPSEGAAAEASGPVVVLTPELPRASDRDTWLAQNHEAVFAEQLAPWTEDEAAWPADRSLARLRDWFDLAWSPAVDDLRDLVVRPPVACGPVSVAALRAEFASLPEGSAFFLDVQSGEMVSFSPEELDALEHEDPARARLSEAEFAEVVRLYESDTLVELPAPSEGLTTLVMESFAESHRVPAVRNRLLNALEAKKPARRFLEAVDASGLRKQWLAHHDEAITELLRETLEYFGVALVGDAPAPTGRPPRARR